MNPAQLAALQAASARLTVAQTAVHDATAAVGAAETANAAAVAANNDNNIATTAVQAVQARVALVAQEKQQQAIDAVIRMMKPTKQFKPVGQPPQLDIEDEKDTFNTWKTQWGLYVKFSTIDEAYQPASGREEYKATQLLTCMSASTPWLTHDWVTQP